MAQDHRKVEAKGPQKYIKIRDEFVDLVSSAIVTATMEYDDEVFDLRENKFSISSGRHGEGIYIYHFYKYIKNGHVNTARWYDVSVPITDIKIDFEHVVDNYELEEENQIRNVRAVFKVRFTDKCFRKIMKTFL